MALRGQGCPSFLVPWAATLLLALGAERALALPEVQKQVRGRAEAELLGNLVSRSPALGSPLSPTGPWLGFGPRGFPSCSPAGPAPEYSRCSGLPVPSPC